MKIPAEAGFLIKLFESFRLPMVNGFNIISFVFAQVLELVDKHA